MIFVETPNFTRAISQLLTHDEYMRMQGALLQMPDVGNIIVGGGGIRKFRWAVKGHGKSGGARVIYYWAVATNTILMLDVYSKGRMKI
jgi:hypothetical protein